MKKFFILMPLIILAFSNLSYSQCYTVLSVKGEIISEKTGQPIKEMDEVCATDKLKFSTKDSKAAVLSPEQGRFVIKFADKKKTNDLVAFVSSVLFAGKENLSTKGMESLEDEFGDKYFVIGACKIYIDPGEYQVSDKCYFNIKYLFDGKEVIRKLKFEKKNLIFDNDIFKIDGKIVDQENIENVSLEYFDKEKNKSTKIASFNLEFANEEVLKSEISNFIDILKKAGKDDLSIISEVKLYINDIYGNVNDGNIRTWLFKNFNIQ
jgi:hypothetical protein